jgi:hypothetical protein
MPHDLVGSTVAEAVVAAAHAISVDLGSMEPLGSVGEYGAAGPAHGGRR